MSIELIFTFVLALVSGIIMYHILNNIEHDDEH